ncbi:hypothetical protein NIES2135_22150 [Leptolyngbya boryana NIES-2135]|jgi:hypothetical protein|uniref:Uncharacterized protein n=1 Tax=Leptolyngbya boryana NIES-2135 TaxID=1973484 RepID=A0A1Z4JF56_LEPBY|nr:MULTISPECIES: hypothetical protein [Leptolyngbya]BAY55392.1 hypothetical protein NIES2135_22150 [Leptolyngbya boryana NIES-2135]MBD2368454.1 hypothetical protein [Leptolyngbya sp. FACHB-161]MBD2374890.1 hypothetical protein [Leptolyngbya sp. FACHB-238]MBD2399310.1 hypothetical protein [Leptolyngbya sp. FACHB-239]MBD2405515.1 hypothetical protein [Leptolyngbya sp. FACHB-402]
MVEFKWELLLDIIRTACTVGTFFIAISAFRIFLKNKLAEKQLDLVIELIREISDSKLIVVYRLDPQQASEMMKRGVAGEITPQLSLFGIASDVSKENSPLFLRQDVCDHLTSISRQYSENPLLPTKIAFSLRQIVPRPKGLVVKANQAGYVFDLCEIPKNSVIYLAQNLENFDNKGIISAFSTYGEFVTVCRDLVISIEIWLSKYGIKDVNALRGGSRKSTEKSSPTRR